VSARFIIEPLEKKHRRTDFSCGNERPRTLYLPVATALSLLSASPA
jgi:hypothetical protein